MYKNINDNKIKISVIVPVYNSEKFLNQCLKSALDQRLKNIEIICINDGSTDKSLEILQNLQEEDNRIKIINQKNLGSGPARNNGIKKSEGEFIAFLDADDYYPDNKVLEDLYLNAKRSKVNICGGNCKMLFNLEKGNLSKNSKSLIKKRQKLMKDDDIVFKKDGLINACSYESPYWYWRFIFKKKFIIDNNLFFPPYRRFQDPPFFSLALCLSDNIYTLKRNSYVYRINHKVIKYDYEKLKDSFLGSRECLRNYEKYNKPIHYTKMFNDFVIRCINHSSYIDQKEENYNKIKDLINDIFENINYKMINEKYLKRLNISELKNCLKRDLFVRVEEIFSNKKHTLRNRAKEYF